MAVIYTAVTPFILLVQDEPPTPPSKSPLSFLLHLIYTIISVCWCAEESSIHVSRSRHAWQRAQVLVDIHDDKTKDRSFCRMGRIRMFGWTVSRQSLPCGRVLIDFSLA